MAQLCPLSPGAMAVGLVEGLLQSLAAVEDLQFAPIGFPKDLLTGSFLGTLRPLAPSLTLLD